MSDNTAAATLSFASKPDLWAIASTGDWAADNETGAAAAIELQDFMRTRDAPFMLGHVLRSMVERGRWSGVEVGFAQTMAQAAVAHQRPEREPLIDGAVFNAGIKGWRDHATAQAAVN